MVGLRVDGFLAARKWPRVEGQLRLWVVCQFGLNKDYRRFRADGLVKAFSLQCFEDWFARVYDKELPAGEHVLCAEVHSNHEERSLDQMIALMNGDLSTVEANNLLRIVTEATNSNTKALGEVIRRMGQLADVILAVRNENNELSTVLREFLQSGSNRIGAKHQYDSRYVL